MEPLAAGDPRQVGVYRLRFRLGAGGMGRVFLGFSPAGRAVAVKIVHPEFARDPEFVRRFGREVRAAEAVSGAYTAAVVAARPDDDPPWLATVFVAGPSLAEVIAEAGPLPEAALWRLPGGLVEALQAVHARGLVHRDLKPANVLMAADGPRVIDFGISRALEGTAVTVSSMIVGTAAFMSPEQAQGLTAGPPSDVFSLGSVIAFAASGAAPFGGGASGPVAAAYRVVHAQPDLSGVPVPLRDLVAGCLAKEPAGRPSLTQLMDAITAGSSPYAGVSPASFWPEPVAGLVSSWQDSFRAQVPPGTELGPGPATPSIPDEPAVPAGSSHGADTTRTSYGAAAGPLLSGTGAARESTPGTAAAASGRRLTRHRSPLIAGAAAAAIGVLAAVVAVYAASGPPAQSTSHQHAPSAPPARAPAAVPHHGQAASSPAPTPDATAPAQATAPPPAPPLTAVTVCTYPAASCTGGNGGTYMKTEPSQIVNSGDGSAYVKDITWSGWADATAAGAGNLELDNCSPDCADGTYTGYPATVTLSSCPHTAAAPRPTPSW